MSDAKLFLQESLELLKEMEVYQQYREMLIAKSKRLYRGYQSGKYGYIEYQHKLKELLHSKTEQEWLSYYNSYEYSLLKRIEYLLSHAFYLVHKDESYKELKISSAPAKKQAREEQPASMLEKLRAGIAALNPLRHKKVFDLDTELKKIHAKPEPHIETAKIQKTELDKKLDNLREKLRKHEEAIKKAASAEPQLKPAPAAAAKVHKLELAPLFTGISRLLKPLLSKISSAFTKASPKKKKPAVEAAPKRLSMPPFARAIISFLRAIAFFPKGVFKVFSLLAKAVFNSISNITKRKPAKSIIKPEAEPAKPLLTVQPKQTLLSKLSGMFAPKKRTIFVEEIVEMEKIQKDTEKQKSDTSGTIIGWASGANILKIALSKEIMSRFSKKQEPVVGETAIPVHIKKLREMRERLYVEEKMTGFETTLLAQEAKRVKKLMEAQKMEEYPGLSIGIIANVTVKRISLFLVNMFPTFFGFLYNSLRSANIRMLSNTYVNIMILSTMILTILTTAILIPLFFALNYPLYQVMLRSVIFGLTAGVLCATAFYAYPFMRIKERRRSTTTNLPFAINHMASVATSGVPPATMFELISTSAEYGEVAVEIKKVVDFTTILGYDLLTAMKAIASTTPSPVFKEFLEGMVSTIETGGDLVSFLKQKSDEAALAYRLERERYNESISTFSDIYTGLLIAAPLFFVAALALVNMLGGKIGGMSVDMVMALGAYVAIPVLNIAFLLFLQVNQPEV